MTQRAIDGDYIYFVTTNVQDRRWFFVTPKRAATLGQAIRTCSAMKKFDLIAYCILPNHVHLLVRKLRAHEEHASDAPCASQRTLGSMGTSDSQQRTLERARCEKRRRPHDEPFLFPHRRLSSRRSESENARFTLSDLMRSIKGTFSRTLPKGKFWQHHSNFRIVETEEYLSNLVEYIRYNYHQMNLSEHYGQPPFMFVDQTAVGRIFGSTPLEVTFERGV